MEPNGWSKDAKLVLHRLDKIDEEICGIKQNELHDIEERLRHIEGKMWVLQTKAAFVGTLAAVGVTILMRYI